MSNHNYKCFQIDIENHIAPLVLSRPNELNTMSRDFWVELGEVLEEINRDSEVRVVVMSSTGKHFCAGMDLNAFSNGVDNIPDDKKPDHARIGEAVYRVAKELQEYISTLEKIRVPVIAAIHGGCIGGAVDLVTACDIRLASDDAFFCIQKSILVCLLMLEHCKDFLKLSQILKCEKWHIQEEECMQKSKKLGL